MRFSITQQNTQPVLIDSSLTFRKLLKNSQKEFFYLVNFYIYFFCCLLQIPVGDDVYHYIATQVYFLE